MKRTIARLAFIALIPAMLAGQTIKTDTLSHRTGSVVDSAFTEENTTYLFNTSWDSLVLQVTVTYTDTTEAPPDTTAPDSTAGTVRLCIDPDNQGDNWFFMSVHNMSNRTLGHIIFSGLKFDQIRANIDNGFILCGGTNDGNIPPFLCQRAETDILLVSGDILPISVVHKSDNYANLTVQLLFGQDTLTVPLGAVEDTELDVPVGDVTPGGTAGIKVKWNPNTEEDLAGYRTHLGLWPGEFYTSIDVANVTEWNTRINRGIRYIIGVSAYDYSFNESDPTSVDYVAE